jgi:hypothetical protein
MLAALPRPLSAECPPLQMFSLHLTGTANPFCDGALLSVCRLQLDPKGQQHHDRHLLDCSGRRCLCLYLCRTRKTCTMSRPAGSWPTEQIVSAAQRGDPRAITTLVCDSHTNVRRFAHMLCSTPEDAEDAAQEALIVLYRRIGTLRATAALASWMFQIVRNECIRRSRVISRRPTLATPVEPSAEDVALEANSPAGPSLAISCVVRSASG